MVPRLDPCSLIAGRSDTWKMTCRGLLPRRFTLRVLGLVLGLHLSRSWACFALLFLFHVGLCPFGLSSINKISSEKKKKLKATS